MEYLYNFKVSVKDKINLKDKVRLDLKLKESEILELKIIKESIDARRKDNVLYLYQVLIVTNKLLKNKGVTPYKAEKTIINLKTWSYDTRPVVVGFGPAGMFAALMLARSQAKPIIIERGSQVEDREEQIKKFWEKKEFDEESNVCFGEGGAGTFSDGKLQSNIKNEFNAIVLEELVKHGANPDIMYKHMPHVGTDILKNVVRNIRKEIISLGGTFYFDTIFEDYLEEKNGLKVLAKSKDANYNFFTKHLILAIGHSAKDTFKMLYRHQLELEPKPFSIGVRIEHLQSKINYIQYGKFAKYLEAAPYKLVCHLPERSVYSFCMCPGGYVVASQSEKNTILTNGMSYSGRDGRNANSALLVEVKIEDFYQNSPLDGFNFQSQWEKACFAVAKNYQAPANLVKEFLEDKIAQNFRSVQTTYPHDVVFTKFDGLLPDFVVNSLREALPLLDKKMPGFCDDDAILIAPETRSSSPVRIKRVDFKATPYIYPIGEGAGYAGGIMTSAIDGLKVALKIINNA